MKIKLKNFTVQLKVVSVVDVEIKAEDMNEALEQAKLMKDTDAVSYKGTLGDSRVAVVGIFGGEGWDT